MASVFQSVGAAVGWRSHEILPDFEESPLPDRFRKNSARNLSALRMSIRKRMPLKEVEINLNENPTWESLEAKEKRQGLRALSRMATNALGNVSQTIQKRCQGPTRSLLTSLASMGNTGSSTRPQSSPPRTPRRKSKRLAAASTPTSATRMVPPSGKRSSGQPGSHRPRREAVPLRRSRRAAALRSPYASPVHVGRRSQLDCDLELVSTGIRQLKRLSRAFNDIIVQEERVFCDDFCQRRDLRVHWDPWSHPDRALSMPVCHTENLWKPLDQVITNYYQVMAQNIQAARLRSRNLSRPLLKRQAARLHRTLGSWADHHFQQY